MSNEQPTVKARVCSDLKHKAEENLKAANLTMSQLIQCAVKHAAEGNLDITFKVRNKPMLDIIEKN